MYDALLIPGAGLLPDGELPPWVRARFDLAISLYQNEFIIPLSAGTIYKPPPLDRNGFPIYESVAGGRYLATHGISPEKILPETCSYDTIGNAYFARVIHVDPRGFERLHVITSRFHMERTKAIFRWVYGMPKGRYVVDFRETPDEGISAPDLQARVAKEKENIKHLNEATQRVHSFGDLHRWLFSQHPAYGLFRPTQDNQDRSISTY
jgi:hypothetical protein